MIQVPKIEKINLFRLSMLSCSFVVSIRNIPMIATTGLQMVFFGIIAAIFFFIPSALVASELSTGWPKEGGIYVWVKEAFGKKWGFFASWLQWTNTLVNIITMLYFVAGSFAFVFAPTLAESRLFILSIVLLVVWACTLTSLKGLKANSLVSTICFLIGVLIPGIIIIILGISYLFMGKPVQLDLAFTAQNIFPDLRHISTLVLLVGFALSFNGIEGSAAHADKVINAKRNYPIAILTVVVLGLCLNLIGALSVAIVVPKENISLIAGIMLAITEFFKQFDISFAVPYFAFMIGLGALGGANSWLLGPIKGLLETAKNGDLPPFFRKTNKHDIPVRLMIIQAIIISALAALLLTSPSINVAFWIAVALSMMIYVTMYIMMMMSAIHLRYSKPQVERAFKIPGKRNLGMWITCLLGLMILGFIFFLGFIPPAQLPQNSLSLFYSVIIGGIVIVFSLPFIISKFKKPEWIHPDYVEKETK